MFFLWVKSLYKGLFWGVNDLSNALDIVRYMFKGNAWPSSFTDTQKGYLVLFQWVFTGWLSIQYGAESVLISRQDLIRAVFVFIMLQRLLDFLGRSPDVKNTQ